MSRTYYWIAAPIAAAMLYGAGQPWKDKRISAWTEDDARRVITESPWAKHVTPEIGPPAGLGLRGGMARSRGGTRRSGGYGYPGGSGYPEGPAMIPTEAPPPLTLRWESALPIRAAELKARDGSAFTIDEAHYAIAVYGVPRHMSGEDSKNPVADLMKHGVLKREGKKDIKPSSVEVSLRDDGAVFLYLFPRSNEITKSDVVEFDAQIGRVKVAGTFNIGEMMCEGKLEL